MHYNTNAYCQCCNKSKLDCFKLNLLKKDHISFFIYLQYPKTKKYLSKTIIYWLVPSLFCILYQKYKELLNFIYAAIQNNFIHQENSTVCRNTVGRRNFKMRNVLYSKIFLGTFLFVKKVDFTYFLSKETVLIIQFSNYKYIILHKIPFLMFLIGQNQSFG